MSYNGQFVREVVDSYLKATMIDLKRFESGDMTVSDVIDGLQLRININGLRME
jgi:hypothetical protein